MDNSDGFHALPLWNQLNLYEEELLDLMDRRDALPQGDPRRWHMASRIDDVQRKANGVRALIQEAGSFRPAA